MTILRNILLLMLILILPAGTAAENIGIQQVKDQLPSAEACTGTPGGHLSCGMLLVLGGIFDKEQGLKTLECAARNEDKTAIAALYSAYALGRHGVPKDMERAEYWAKLGGITMPCHQTVDWHETGEDIVYQKENIVEPKQCDHDDVRFNTLKRNTVAGDKAAGNILFDLYMKRRYTPCPEVKAALVKRGLLKEVTVGED